MVSRRVKPRRHSQQPPILPDNATQEAVNVNPKEDEEPQVAETGHDDEGAVTETKSTPEGAGMASSHDQDEPMQSEPDAKLDDTTTEVSEEVPAAPEAPASEVTPPTSAVNFSPAHTPLAYSLSPTPHSPQTRPFSPPSRLLSPVSFSVGSPPVAPPPSPASAPYHPRDTVAAEPFFHQLPYLPNSQSHLPQMYSGSHNQGQFPYNNNTSRWMPPMTGTPGMASGNVQNPQQGKIQTSTTPRPPLPFGFTSTPSNIPGAVPPTTTSGTSSVSHLPAVVPRAETPAPPPGSPSVRVSTPVSSPSAVSATAAIKLKKNEYKGPLIVSSYPIPYNLLSREVMHFLGRRAKLLPEKRGSSIHVIMERSTAKTMDCYVELLTQGDAQEALAWVNRNLPAHSPRLGDRHVHVDISSQDELLREMFPRAKCVIWTNGYPEVQPNLDSFSTGFQGFLTNEEMFCMVHHAEAPKRAPFAEKCPQRPYEFMISTLDKFPWFAKSLYTVEHRNVLFDATRRQLQALVTHVNARRVIQLDARLLRDLLNAGLRCPAFNERQKYLLRVAAEQEQGGTPRTSMFWPFDTLSRKGSAREESVEEYARLIRAAVLRRVPNFGELNNSWDAIQHGNSPFGPLMLEWRGEGARRSLQAAINAEIGVMRALVSEGLAAINTAV
ncbi:uncharacterized protein GIQ15_00894 [Arthroderma uncinatum]|uniref:uncharacterized protein n=1 Tax=Arthroderma uncinatum TaxID=74035 RepID=UPI00144AA928|nr:uncharacterized protein GIQ15_00894 [Arthroderma uncinatum]KAF3491377.1 hypothetical protein GIQ15_00894 [Arthroderma uncinatum]